MQVFSSSSVIRSQTRLFTAPETVTGKVFLVVGASLIVALCAHVSLPLPWTPVPMTLSDLAVLVIGLLLGPIAGFSALMLYLLEGAAGLPVFTPGGLGGVAQLLGPTGGFLFSYPLVAASAGYLEQFLARKMPDFPAGLLAAACASILLFGAGAAWLGALLHLTGGRVVQLAVLPFLPGNLVKVIAAASVYSAFHHRRRRA